MYLLKNIYAALITLVDGIKGGQMIFSKGGGVWLTF